MGALTPIGATAEPLQSIDVKTLATGLARGTIQTADSIRCKPSEQSSFARVTIDETTRTGACPDMHYIAGILDEAPGR